MNLTFPNCTALLMLGAISVLPPKAQAQSQAEMNHSAASSFGQADRALNVVYSELVSKMDKESRLKLQAAQRAWINFRDAEAELISDLDARGGSMAPMIYNGKRAEITKERTRQLKAILKEYAH